MSVSDRERNLPAVLIVDDESKILTALRRSLRREGYLILTAETPNLAIKMLEERSVDLVISDQKMPGMSGLELLEEAKRLRPEATRMLITGWAEAISPGQLDALDIKAVIPKPWDDAELKELLRKTLALRPFESGL